MPNKTVIYTTPVVDNIVAINIRFDGTGGVSGISGNVRVASDDATSTANQIGSFDLDVTSLPAGLLTAITNIIPACLTKYKSDNGF